MTLFGIIMFAAAALTAGLGIAIRRGNTGLIHDYHRENVKEEYRMAYAKDFSRGIFVMALSMLACGLIALIGNSKPSLLIGTGVLFAGFSAAAVMLVRTQKKYNGKVM